MRWKKKPEPVKGQYRIRKVTALLPTEVQDEVLFMERYYEVSEYVEPWNCDIGHWWVVMKVPTLARARNGVQQYHTQNHWGTPSIFEEPCSD